MIMTLYIVQGRKSVLSLLNPSAVTLKKNSQLAYSELICISFGLVILDFTLKYCKNECVNNYKYRVIISA